MTTILFQNIQIQQKYKDEDKILIADQRFLPFLPILPIKCPQLTRCLASMCKSATCCTHGSLWAPCSHPDAVLLIREERVVESNTRQILQPSPSDCAPV